MKLDIKFLEGGQSLKAMFGEVCNLSDGGFEKGYAAGEMAGYAKGHAEGYAKGYSDGGNYPVWDGGEY